jgi:hypothetical protein
MPKEKNLFPQARLNPGDSVRARKTISMIPLLILVTMLLG